MNKQDAGTVVISRRGR